MPIWVRVRPQFPSLDGVRRRSWLIPVTILFAGSRFPNFALNGGWEFAVTWISGACAGYLWHALNPKKLESRLLPWVYVFGFALGWMTITNGNPKDIRDSASLTVLLVGIVCGLIVRGSRNTGTME